MSMPHTIRIRNGQRLTRRTFSDREMQRRVKQLRKHLSAAAIDAALFTSIHCINYYDDFVYCSFGRPYGLVVTGDACTSVTANIDGGEPLRRGFADNLIYTDWQRDNYLRALQQLIPDRGRIGIEFDHVNLAMRRKLEAAFPNAELVDIAQAAMRMRMIKSAEEIALIKAGARAANVGGDACLEAIAPGVPEHEVALHSTQAMVRHIAEQHPHTSLMDTWTWFQSGINTDGAHNPVTTRRIRRGDILSINCFPMISGYYTALERTAFCASASKAHRKVWEVNMEVYRRGLELIEPGARCCDIAHTLNAIYAKARLLQYRTFGYGHSFGTLCHYYGREAGLELREDIDTVLEPNMVLSMEPMLMLPEGKPGAGGYREHDILVIGRKDAQNITNYRVGPEQMII